MRLKAVATLSVLFVSMFITNSIEADQPEAEDASGLDTHLANDTIAKSEVSRKKEEKSCGQGARPMRVAVRHIEPNGIGYNQGYTTAEGFFSFDNGWDQWALFLDGRIHVFNNGEPALNAGLGARYLTNSRVWGANAYYDYRKTSRYHYNQVTAGLESLGEVWDFRLNGYAPVGRWTSPHYDLAFAYFRGHNAILRQKYEYALGGLNAEAAAHVDKWKHFPLYFAAGPYYLNGRGGTAWGGQARASVQMYDYVKIEGNVSYDHLFGWIGQGQLALSFSFGKEKELKNSSNRCSMTPLLSERMVQPVDRFEIIPVDHNTDHLAAINPLTGEPYYFAFVDNLSSSLGTYESPYATLSDAETNSGPHDIIYIFPGNGTATGMNSGIELQNYQRLWGSGVAQSLPTTNGLVTIAAQSNSIFNGVVISPSIANTTPGNVITVADNNEISGLFIQNQSTYSCISASDNSNLSVLHSTLAAANAAGDYGIDASGLTGALTVSNCIINQKINNVILTNTEGNLNVIVSNCAIDNSTTTSTPAIGWTLSNAAQGTLTIENSSFASVADAVDITLSDTSSITTAVKSNQITSSGNGFYINSTSGSTDIALVFQNNTITAYDIPVNIQQTGTFSGDFTGNNMFSSDDYAFELTMGSDSSDATLVMSQNSWISADEYVMYIDQSGGNLTATLTDNTLSATDEEYALYAYQRGSAGSQTFNLYKNTINGYAALYFQPSVGTQTLNIIDNTLTGYEYPIYYDQSDTNTVTATINDNVMYSLYDEACIYWSASGASTQLSATGNALTGEYGLYLDQDSTGTSTVSFNENSALCYYSAYITISDGTANLSMTDNDFNALESVYIDQTGGTTTISITDNSLIASGPNSIFHSVSGGTSTLTVSGNSIVAGGSADNAAIVLSYSGGGIIADTTVSNNTLSCPTGALLGTFGVGTYDVTISDNTVVTGGGMSLTADETSATTLYVEGNQFSALSSTPVAILAQNTASICMHLNDNTAYPISGAYTLTNSGTGTFTLNPTTGNIGQIVESGTITPGTCP